MTAAQTQVTETTAHVAPGFLPWVSALVHQHRQRLLAHARRRGLGAEDALDAVQDGFVSFLGLPEAREIANAPEDAIKLLTVIVGHQANNRRRKQSRHSRLQPEVEAAEDRPSDTSEQLVARMEELGRAHGCILRMAELQRRVVMLSLLDDQPSEEVGRLLGLTPGYVRVLLHRARAHLRSCEF